MEFKQKVLKQVQDELSVSLNQVHEQVKGIQEKAKLEAAKREADILKEYELEANKLENLIQEKKIELKNEIESYENELVLEDLNEFYSSIDSLRKDKDFQKTFKKLVDKTVKEAGKDFQLSVGTVEATYLKGKVDKNLKGALIHNDNKTIVFDLSLESLFEKIKPFLYNTAYKQLGFDKK
ncbi:V-type proton ATPase subunit E [uncultured archaeon]|nr:V-type proton ATPase subunit E [uncultured archaeon]